LGPVLEASRGLAQRRRIGNFERNYLISLYSTDGEAGAEARLSLAAMPLPRAEPAAALAVPAASARVRLAGALSAWLGAPGSRERRPETPA
jgi:hypothetical protein